MTELTELSSEPLGYFASNANTTFAFGSNHTLYLKARRVNKGKGNQFSVLTFKSLKFK